MGQKSPNIFQNYYLTQSSLTTVIKLDLIPYGVDLEDFKDYRMRQFTSGIDLDPAKFKFEYYTGGVIYFSDKPKSTGTSCAFLIAQWKSSKPKLNLSAIRNTIKTKNDNVDGKADERAKEFLLRRNIVTYKDFQNGRIVNTKDGFDVQLGLAVKDMEGFLSG